jgi:hypothetical protein
MHAGSHPDGVTNDAHYSEKKATSRRTSLCIGTKRTRTTKPHDFDGDQFYLKEGDEWRAFPEYPKCSRYTVRIAEIAISRYRSRVPSFRFTSSARVPEQERLHHGHRHEGLKKRIPSSPTIRQRADYEISTII